MTTNNPALLSLLLALGPLLVGCGTDVIAFSSDGGTAAPATCAESPASKVDYSTVSELDTLIVGRWQRCGDAVLPNETVGVEFTEDGHYYPLARDKSGAVVRLTGIDNEYEWSYQPQPPVMFLDSVYDTPPEITADPTQLRISFTPVLSKYIPLDP